VNGKTHINSEQYVDDILGPFLRTLQKKDRHSCVMQDGITAHTANYFINVLNELSEDRLISCRVWPARCPDLNR
jgi:hypothetical protein